MVQNDYTVSIQWVVKTLQCSLPRCKCNLRYSKRDDNLLTFVRLASWVMIRDHEDNTYPFLRKGRQFVGEFGDAFEVEAVGRRDGHLEKDSDISGDVNSVNGFCS